MRSNMGKITVAPQQRKDGPCFQDVGLWRRMLTRAQQGNLTNHHFFVVDVVEGCLHSSMFCTLSLPPAFMEHHRKRLKEHITLEGADGHKWFTMLGLQLDSQYCLNIGWKEFAADSNLEINDQIVFLLFEDSHFLVQVFDANNNFKGRVLASPAKGGDGIVNVVSQVGMQQRKEANVAEKTKTNPGARVQAHGQGTNNPPLYFDTKTVNLSTDRSCSKVDANSALRRDSSSVPRSKVNGKDIIEIPDSSEDEDERMPLQPTHWDGSMTSTLRIGAKQTISRCSIKVTRVDAEDQMQATQEDVSDRIKRQPPRQPSRITEIVEPNNLTQKAVQSDEDHNEGTVHIDNGSLRVPGTQPASRSPPSSITAPSSPEHVMIIKRSRKSRHRNSDYDEDDVDWTPNSVRSESLRRLFQEKKEGKEALRGENVSLPGVNAGCNPVKSKRDAVASRANKVTEAAKIRSPDNKKMKAPESLPKGMKRTPVTPLGQPASEALNATERVADVVADDGGTGTMPQENGGSKVIQSTPPQMPEGVGSRPPVQARPKVKAHKKREKPCLPPEESRPLPEEEPKVIFKRPKIAKIGPTKVHKFLYISRRRPVTDQERNDTLATAQKYALPSTNKHYLMQLRASQVYCGYHLGVSPEFVEALQFPLVRVKMTFFDETGKTWEVDWQGDHPQKPGFNSTGWTKFVLDHFLEEGDVCIFELPDPKVFNISVTIFPIVPLDHVPELGWKSHYGGEHTGEKIDQTARSL